MAGGECASAAVKGQGTRDARRAHPGKNAKPRGTTLNDRPAQPGMAAAPVRIDQFIRERSFFCAMCNAFAPYSFWFYRP